MECTNSSIPRKTVSFTFEFVCPICTGKIANIYFITAYTPRTVAQTEKHLITYEPYKNMDQKAN